MPDCKEGFEPLWSFAKVDPGFPERLEDAAWLALALGTVTLLIFSLGSLVT